MVKYGTQPEPRTREKKSFIENVKRVLEFPLSSISAPPFNCQMSESAAEENLKILEENDMSIGKVIEQSPFPQCLWGPNLNPLKYLNH